MKYNHIRRLADRWPLVLGSGSPRRVALLGETGVKFTQIIPNLEEPRHPDETPFAYAQRLAEDKALRVAEQVEPDHLVIGSDTIVVWDDRIFYKPGDESEAFEILLILSGRKHVVCTALALTLNRQLLASAYELTAVRFNSVTAEQIRGYIATGEPMDKAGAYGIQGMGAFLVDRIEGNLDNVIGLPRVLLNRLAAEILAKKTIERERR
jgi:septum formation protein